MRFSQVHKALFSTLLTFLLTPAGPAHAQTDSDQLKRESRRMLADLAEPILRCLDAQHQTVDHRSPYFSSCVDWRSSVHARYALYAISKHTGPGEKDRAEHTFKRHPTSSELSCMQTKVVRNIYDNPYGFAWLLRLAQEREEVTGDAGLRPLAGFASTQIKLKLRNSQVTVHNTEYHNPPWAIINYYQWAEYTKNSDEIAYARSVIRDRITPVSCDPHWDTLEKNAGYFGKCLMSLAAVATAEAPSATPWITNQMPLGFAVPPRHNSGSSHINGLNFTHAFALAWRGQVTQRDDLINNAARLMAIQYQQPSARNGTHLTSHWIPQLGVLALDEIKTDRQRL